MSPAFPYTPFPFSVTPISPLFQLSPVASNNTSLGWVPSCVAPECIPTASWSTNAVNSTLSFQYWGWDLAFDGSVTGNMSVQLLHDGVQALWNPSGGTLFSLWGRPTDYLYSHNITLKILDASPDAQLTITQARVNGSSYADAYSPANTWTIPSDDDSLEYTGFTPQVSEEQTESTVYMSSTAGDTVSMSWNASTFLMYGPCGPTNGLIKVTIDSQQRIQEQIVNTSSPFVSDHCILFQAWGLTGSTSRNLILVENVDGGKLGIDRFELFRIQYYAGSAGSTLRAGIVAGAVLGTIIVSVAVIVVYVRRTLKKQEGDGHFTSRYGFKWLCL